MNETPRERILAGGPAGSGKTYAFLKVVQHMPKASHLAIEVDDGFAKLLLSEFPDIAATCYEWSNDKWEPKAVQRGTKLRVFHCSSFKQVLSAQRELERLVQAGEITGDSWVSIDGIDLLYNNMRYELIEKGLTTRANTKNSNIEDAWDAALEQRGKGAPLLDGGDWDMIHSFYENLLGYCAFKIPANLFCTTNVTTIEDKSPFERDDIKDFYNSLGVKLKFEGQKRTVRVFDTLLLFKHNPGNYTINIWKDRGGQGRKWNTGRHSTLMDYTNNDFYTDIGVKLFGWKEDANAIVSGPVAARAN